MTYAESDFPNVVFPTIHLNGNEGRKLGNQYWDAVKALDRLRDSFSDIEFHARDYYVQSDQAFKTAQLQRQEIFNQINAIREYLEAHASHCFESAAKNPK